MESVYLDKYVTTTDLQITHFADFRGSDGVLQPNVALGWDWMNVETLPAIELDSSRDRAVSGYVSAAMSGLKLKFTGPNNQDLGIYEISPSGNSPDALIYESEDKLFGDEEFAQYQGGSLDPRAKTQAVAFIRENGQVRFHTIADKLGEFKVTMLLNGNEIHSVTRTLTADNEFFRLIAVTEKFIAGDDPPAINAWGPIADPPITVAVTSSSAASTRSLADYFYWGTQPETRTEIQLPDVIRNRGLVAKCLLHWARNLINAQVATGEGVVFGIWDGIKSDVEGVVDTIRLPIDFYNILNDPWAAAGELYNGFAAIKDLGWEEAKNNIIGMFEGFMDAQQERLETVLSDEAQDPAFLAAYMAGYLGGYVGEQAVVVTLTAGAVKAGMVGKAIRGGKQLVVSSINNLGTEAKRLQKLSRGFTRVQGEAVRSADEARAVRSCGSKCGADGGCVVSGTLVWMGDGTWKRIDDIRTGDWVMADDPSDNLPPAPAQVEYQVLFRASELVEVRVDSNHDGYGDAALTLSGAHPVYVTGNGWTFADKLESGQMLRDSAGNQVRVLSNASVEAAFTVYDLGIHGPDTYFIASSSGVSALVHNGNFDVSRYADEADIVPRSNPPVRYRKHHFYHDAWLAANYEGLYQKGRKDTTFPIIQLTPEDHILVHQEANAYLQEKLGKSENQMTADDWRKLKAPDMKEMTDRMARKINLPVKKRNEIKNAQNAWIRDAQLRAGVCGS